MTAPVADRTVYAIAFPRTAQGDALHSGPTSGRPDPSRLRSLVRRLPELGFAVDHVGMFVHFHGPESIFVRVLGAAPTPVSELPPGPELAAWADAVVGAPTPSSPAPARGGPLAHQGQAMPHDLVLGEIGRTLGTGDPTWLTDRTTFPHPDLTAATTTALREYAGLPWRAELTRHLRVLRALQLRPAVDGMVVESSGPDLGRAFARLLGPPALPAVHAEGGMLTATDSGWEVSAREQGCRHWWATVDPVFLEAIRARETLRYPALPTWPTFSAVAHRLAAELNTLLLLDPNPDPAVHAANLALVSELSTRLTAFQDAFADTEESPRPAWDQLMAVLTRVGAWAVEQAAGYWSVAVSALRSRAAHGAMVSTAFLAVTLDDVPLWFVRDTDVVGLLWDSPLAPQARTVFSGSFGASATADLTPADVDTAARVSWARRTAPDALTVISGGNAGPVPGDGVPYATLHAGHDSVLVVGGCAPGPAGGWVACDQTVGLSIAVPATATQPARTVTSPEICAVTADAAGGSALHPEDAGLATWWFGGGSSQSAPIVAGVCALVWSLHPYLTAAQVKQVVLAGAAELDGGVFHFPREFTAGAVVGSHVVRSPTAPQGNTAKRVCLEAALDEADALAQTLPDPFGGFVQRDAVLM